MYEIPRKLWFAGYVVLWGALWTTILCDVPLPASILLSVVWLAFATLTDPAPRDEPLRVSRTCDCERCERMRSRHTRRRTDTEKTL